jgi:hypothetical protein
MGCTACRWANLYMPCSGRLTPNEEIAGFLAGTRPDDRGRYLRQIQQWPDERLEHVHDFIQWMFPLQERSAVNPEAPVLDAATIAEIRSDRSSQENLRISFHRMLAFYGLQVMPESELRVGCARNFGQRAANWLSGGNHNHLRITRIIKSLNLLGMEAEARALLECLKGIYEEERKKPSSSISERTFRFWSLAAEDPLE